MSQGACRASNFDVFAYPTPLASIPNTKTDGLTASGLILDSRTAKTRTDVRTLRFRLQLLATVLDRSDVAAFRTDCEN